MKQQTANGIRFLCARQETWVLLALVLFSLLMSFISPVFCTYSNLQNVSRNFSYIALIAMGQVAVIITGGIDLSVGSVMALSGVVTGIVLESGYPLSVAIFCGLTVGLLCGLFNGLLIARLRLSPFVVTLASMTIARSLALVLAASKVIYQFGPDHDRFLKLGGGELLGLSLPFWDMICVALVFGFCLRNTRWGRHLYAIGGNERAAVLNGVPVVRAKLLAYVFSALLASVAAILMVGWLGAVTNELGKGYELAAIAAAVIGGTRLIGGFGSAFGAVLGAMLLEVIRNALVLAGIDAFWQGTFVGLFILAALLIERAGKSP